MWSVVFGSVLMCLDQTWCDSLCLGSVLMYLNQIWCDPLCWCDLIIVKKLKDSKNLKVPKSSLKLQEVCCLRKKNSSENLKSLRRISKEIFQVSKIQERFQNGWVWMMNFLNDFDFHK